MKQNVVMLVVLVTSFIYPPLAAMGQQTAAGTGDLRAITPACGTSPATGKDVMQFASLVLGRASAWPNSENLKWVDAVRKATGESPESELAFASIFAQRLNVVFGSQAVDLQTSAKLLKRLGTVTPADLERWSKGLSVATGTSVSKIDAALAVVCVDRLFPAERWVAARAASLEKRLMQLLPDVVSEFVASNPAFDGKRVPTDAPVALVLVDALFPAESFSRDAFSKALGK